MKRTFGRQPEGRSLGALRRSGRCWVSASRLPPGHCFPYPVVIQSARVVDLLVIDLLDEDDPFEMDKQVAHLFKHAALGLDDVYEV